MYVEHLNEMKSVIDKLYLVPLVEKEGRQFCTNTGPGWAWSGNDDDPLVTVDTTGMYGTGEQVEKGESAPFSFAGQPIGPVEVAVVKMTGSLQGIGDDLTAKFINFLLGDPGDPQPTDRDWKAELRISSERPDDPRGGSTTKLFEDNLADDGSHTSDAKNVSTFRLEVYIQDYWGPMELSSVPDSSTWPFWLTFVMEDAEDVIVDYAAEAAATGRELQMYYARASFEVTSIWAELDFEYLAT
jgi:hypothetical protein